MKKTLPLIRKLQVALGAAFATLLVVGGLSYYTLHGTTDLRRQARNAHEVLDHLQSLNWAIDNVRAAHRGYASSGDDVFIQQAIANRARADREKLILKTLTAGNAAQQGRLTALAALSVTTVESADTAGAPAGQVDAVRAIQLDMVSAERMLLADLRIGVERSLRRAEAGLIFGGLLGIVFVAIVAIMARRYYALVSQAGSGFLASEERIRVLVEGVQDYAIYMLDPHGKVISWNAGAQRIKGYSADEVIGTNFSRFYSPEDVSRGIPHQELAMAAASGRIESERWRIRKDGSRFLANLVITAARDSSGTLIGFSEISRDISERKDTEAKYRGLLEAAPDAMVVVDQGGEIVLLNVQAEKQFGYPRDELLGQKVTAIIPEGFAERLIADGTRSAADALAQQIGTGIELSARRKDGSAFPIEIMLSPLESKEGILVTAAIRDISVRKDTEARYRGLLEAAPDAMVVVDQGGNIVLLNVQAEKQFGYPRDELLGQKVTAIIPEGFAERLIADGTRTAAEALAQQIGTGIELSARRKDGSAFPIEIMLSPLENTEGILVTAAIRDISVRKDTEAKYRGLLEAAPDAMVVVDQDGKIVLLNVQAEKQFGYRRDELLGQQVTNIIPEGFAERLIADETRTAAEALAQQIGTGIELLARRKDRSAFPIEIMLSPLESEEGILITAAIRDISVRKAAEAHLEQMEGRYRGLLEAAPDAMVVVDQGGTIVLLNVQTEKQFGYRRNELLGQKVTNIIPEGFAERLIADGTRSAADALAQQIGTGIELSARRKDGTEFPIEIMLSPLQSAEGILVTAAIRDISVRKQTLGELKRSNAELEHFAYVASHDLQEPLRMVASYTELLAKRYKGRLDSDADDFISFAVDGSHRMQRLINDLLEYSRAGANSKKPHKISSELALQGALINLQASIAESGATVTHDALPDVTMDDTQLTQVFQNLIGNAVKYHGKEAPRVHISARTNAGTESVFSVKDNGLGIEAQYFEKIFVLFQRLHGRSEFEGTGIGLAVCKKMLERLGGRIWVESLADEGSTFHFSVPEGVAA